MARGYLDPLDPEDTDARAISFAAVVGVKADGYEGETITLATPTVTNDDETGAVANGLVVVANSTVITKAKCSVVLNAVTKGNYVLTFEIETSAGRRLNRSATIAVEDL